MSLDLFRGQDARVDRDLVQPAHQEALEVACPQSQGRGPAGGFDLPLGVIVERPGRGGPQPAYAVLVNVDARPALRVGVPGVETGHDVQPLPRRQLVLEVRAGTEVT